MMKKLNKIFFFIYTLISLYKKHINKKENMSVFSADKLYHESFYTLYKLYIWNVRKPPKFHATQTQPLGESSHSSNATRKENNLWKKIFIFGKPLSLPHPIFPFIECIVYRDLYGILRTSLSHFTLWICSFTMGYVFSKYDILVMFYVSHISFEFENLQNKVFNSSKVSFGAVIKSHYELSQ